jgi:hypothetical protein
MRRPATEAVAAEVVVSAEGAQLLASAPLAASGSAMLALRQRVRESSRAPIASVAA